MAAKIKEEEGNIVEIVVIPIHRDDIVEHQRNLVPVKNIYWSGSMTEK